MPYGILQMDNGEVLLLGSAETRRPNSRQLFEPVTALSSDGGATWTEFARIPDMPDARPSTPVYLGKGDLSFGAEHSFFRVFSHNYGRTWTDRVAF